MTKGEEIIGTCCCEVNYTCLACQVDEAIIEEKKAFQDHVKECSSGFYGKLAAKKCEEVKKLEKELADLKNSIWEIGCENLLFRQ